MRQIETQKDMTSCDYRHSPDRRRNKYKSVLCSFYMGRRRAVRRKEEAILPFYTDVYEKWVGMIFISIIMLSSLDAILTLSILDRGGKELNPVMDALLEIDDTVFFIGKLILTLFSLLFVLIHINFKLLRVIPMRQVLVALFLAYSCLIGYEGLLLSV